MMCLQDGTGNVKLDPASITSLSLGTLWLTLLQDCEPPDLMRRARSASPLAVLSVTYGD
jgi:hypothetical protein